MHNLKLHSCKYNSRNRLSLARSIKWNHTDEYITPFAKKDPQFSYVMIQLNVSWSQINTIIKRMRVLLMMTTIVHSNLVVGVLNFTYSEKSLNDKFPWT